MIDPTEEETTEDVPTQSEMYEELHQESFFGHTKDTEGEEKEEGEE